MSEVVRKKESKKYQLTKLDREKMAEFYEQHGMIHTAKNIRERLNG